MTFTLAIGVFFVTCAPEVEWAVTPATAALLTATVGAHWIEALPTNQIVRRIGSILMLLGIAALTVIVVALRR